MLPVIAGVVSRSGRSDARQDCGAMLSALALWNSGATVIAGSHEAALGSRGGPAPCRSTDGEWLLAGSVRVDARRNLLRELGIDCGEELALSDQELLLRAWLRWREQLLDRITGDAAFAALHLPSRELWLGRSAVALRPLFYRLSDTGAAFASHPVGLFALPGASKQLNLDHAALMAAQYSFVGSPTIFAGIARVCPGEVVRIADERARSMYRWRPVRRLLPVRSAGEAAEAIRSAFDRAVADMVGDDGQVAAQLSSGRDSSAVAAAAASRLAGQGRRLLALTGAPAEGCEAPSVGDRIADESTVAAATAGRYSNVEHRVCRPPPGLALASLRDLNRLHHQPVTNFGNAHWWIALHQAAAGAGAKVMLTGAAGNFTVSAGPAEHLLDVVQEEGMAVALRVAEGMPNRLGAARVLAGAMLPGGAYRTLLRLSGWLAEDETSVPIVREPLRRLAEERLRVDNEPLGWRSGFDLRAHLLLDADATDPMVPAMWGMETRDPTADRRVIEACFGVPARYLVPQRGDPRPLYRMAFGDLVPDAVVAGRRRGYQGADWYEQFPRAAVKARFEELLANPAVEELFDAQAIRGLLEHWPSSGWAEPRVIHTYRGLMLKALAVADFIDHHWPV